jgi:hypothetical protein
MRSLVSVMSITCSAHYKTNTRTLSTKCRDPLLVLAYLESFLSSLALWHLISSRDSLYLTILTIAFTWWQYLNHIRASPPLLAFFVVFFAILVPSAESLLSRHDDRAMLPCLHPLGLEGRMEEELARKVQFLVVLQKVRFCTPFWERSAHMVPLRVGFLHFTIHEGCKNLTKTSLMESWYIQKGGTRRTLNIVVDWCFTGNTCI